MNIQSHLAGLRERLRACKATNAALVAASDGRLSESWISKFRSGHLHNPRLDTLVALDAALKSCEQADLPRAEAA
jgi:hypothetical protein